ncbi:MAG: hypothetical protein EA409_02240 [Saprospirales bacterium]|nr:MAG: hypothetical protein EA409_02240 [Saprospirales bacterium]
MQYSANQYETIETEPKGESPAIKAVSIFHRGAQQIALRFPYNDKIRVHIKKLAGLKWSQTNKCFYIADTVENRRRLINHCRGLVWVDMMELKRVSAVDFRNKVNKCKPEQSKSADTKADFAQPIKEMVEYMEQRRYSPSTIQTYRSMVAGFLNHISDKKWDKVTSRDIEQYNYREFILKNKARSTQNQFINAIKLFYGLHSQTALELDQIQRPRREVKLPEVLTREEVSGIIKCTKNKKQRTLFALIYSCGLRIGETLKLKWSDIRRHEKLIYIRGGKGHKDRRVPLSSKMVSMLEEYALAYRTEDYVFEGQKGGMYNSRSAQSAFKRSVKAAGIHRKITLHSLRHSYATHLLEAGVGLRYIQEILGHANPKTTMLYTHISGKQLREIRSPIEDLEL